MPAFDLFSIGRSNIPAGRFLAALQSAGVNAVADARYDDACDLFEAGQASRLAAAYRRRAKAVAFRQKSSASRRAAEKR
jgi:hypothetical protein